MFDSVLGRGVKPKTRFGAGTVISVLLYGALLAVFWWISTAPVDLELPDTAVTFYAAPPPPPPPPPPAKKKTVERKPQKMKPDVIVQPTVIPTEKPPEVEQPPEEVPETTGDDDEGVEGGVEGGVVGGVVGGVLGGTIGGTGTKDVMAFGEGMTRPERVSGADPVYTREALEAHVQGLMIVKCVIGVDGYLSNCRIIKPLPRRSIRYANSSTLSTPLEVCIQPARSLKPW